MSKWVKIAVISVIVAACGLMISLVLTLLTTFNILGCEESLLVENINKCIFVFSIVLILLACFGVVIVSLIDIFKEDL
jgi:uncharacterized protein YacL